MKKILFVYSRLSNEGPVKQLFYLTSLLKSPYRSQVLTLFPERNSSLMSHFRRHLIYIHKYSPVTKNIFRILKISISSFSGLSRYEVIHSYGLFADLTAIILKSFNPRVSIITSVRTTFRTNYQNVYGYWLGSVISSLHYKIISRFDRVIACSESVRYSLQPCKFHIDVVRNCIPGEDVFYSGDPPSLPSALVSTPYFLTISSLRKGKNIEPVLDAFALGKVDGIQLLVAGNCESSIMNKYGKQKNIKFLGHVSCLKHLIERCIGFISLSLHEGLPNAPLEALRAGKPVILSDIKPHREILAGAPSFCGELIPVTPHLGKSLLVSIIISYANKKAGLQQYSESIKNYIHDEFSPSRAKIQYVDIIESLTTPR